MRILVLGGDGMLGHAVFMLLRRSHDARVTLRRSLDAYADHRLFAPGNAYAGIDVRAPDALGPALSAFCPQAVVNAVGIVKQRAESEDPVASIEVNSLFPHRLARACRELGARLIQLSTDCVFSGEKGNYRESDRPDAAGLYGRSKLLGEVTGEGAVTLRTSMIGRGLKPGTGLVDWFLAQRGRVAGYRNAVFSGLSTAELARVIAQIIERHGEARGLYHVSAAPISKLDLLSGLKERLGLRVDIVPTDEPRIDRSLDSTLFRATFSYVPPAWGAMLDELTEAIRREPS